MNTTSNNGRVPFISKIAYGMGDVGCNFSWMFVSNFLMIFYTDVFGIGMSAVATLMLVSRIWDAVNDPIIGTLTDKTHTRRDVSVLGFCSSSYYSYYTHAHILGTSRLEPDCKDCVYGCYLLHLGAWLHLRQPALRHTLRGYDTRY